MNPTEFESGWDGFDKHRAELIDTDAPGMLCKVCGQLPSDERHWNEHFLENIGPAAFHRWYYNTDVWRRVSFMGVYCAKNVLDLWNYQEILWRLKPAFVVEFGTYAGGSALYLAWILQSVWMNSGTRHVPKVMTFDNGMAGAQVDELVKDDEPNIVLYRQSSIAIETAIVIDCNRKAAEKESPCAVFFILDSDHHKEHVLAELEMLRSLTRPGDYVVVEDGNINGHPVLPDWGPGPWEAIEEYERRYPDDYQHDTERERKFGMTFAPKGYLIRK